MIEMEKMNTEYAPCIIRVYNSTETSEIDSSDGTIESISIQYGCYDGTAIGIGSVYEPKCDITMDENENIKLGTELDIFFSINGTWKRVGRFWVSDLPRYEGEKMSITAKGALWKYGSKQYRNEELYLLRKASADGDGLEKVHNKIKEILDGLTGYGIEVVYDKESVFAEWEIEAPKFKQFEVIVTDGDSKPIYPKEWYAYISVKELLAGIAVMYGGNIIEKNGKVYLQATRGLSGTKNFSIQNCEAGYEYSRVLYWINDISMTYLPVRTDQQITHDKTDDVDIVTQEFTVYNGTERATKALLVSQVSGLGDIRYSQNVECDWIGFTISHQGGCFTQGDTAYKTGRFSFVGFNENLQAGNFINIYIDEENYIPFIIGEVRLIWDGGFTTEVSCQCSVDTAYPTASSSTSSAVTSASNVSSATSGYYEKLFAKKEDLKKHEENKNIHLIAKEVAEGVYSHRVGPNAGEASGENSFIGGGIGNTASGSMSAAFGDNTKATGQCSFSTGKLTTASGKNSRSGGDWTTASGENSLASGYKNVASGKNSSSFGETTESRNLNSSAFGYKTISAANNSFSSGNLTVVKGENGFSCGKSTKTLGINGFSCGNSTEAKGINSFSSGFETAAEGAHSHSEGSGSAAVGDASHAENGASALGSFSHAEGNGSSNEKYSHAEGYMTSAGAQESLASENSEQENVKRGSHAEGYQSAASGAYSSHAEGYKASATGGYGSHAEGNATSATAKSSHSEGTKTIASGISSHSGGNGSESSGESAFGHGLFVKASGARSVAMGERTTAIGETSAISGISTENASERIKNLTTSTTYNEIKTAWDTNKFSIAFGNASKVSGKNCIAYGEISTAEGSETIASGANSHSEGNRSDASGQNSHAENSSAASGKDSHSEGTSKSQGTASHSEGNGNISLGDNSHSEGSGTSSGMIYLNKAYGTSSHAEGSNTTTFGEASHCEGISTNKAINVVPNPVSAITEAKFKTLWESNKFSYVHTKGGHCEGKDCVVLGGYGHAEGEETYSNATSSHCEGRRTYTGNKYAHAEGNESSASGVASHSEGSSTSASGSNSHSEGLKAVASGENSHSEGEETDATGKDSHSEGKLTLASGANSHSEGENTVAKNVGSHTEGKGTVSAGDYSHVQGRYNAYSSTTPYAHVVGNGTSETDRKNIHTLDWSGGAWFAGDVINGNGVSMDWLKENICSGEGTSDYSALKNKPQIEGVELSGNKTLEQLGIHMMTESETLDILNS